MIKRKLQVFVSSTYEDLIEYRLAAMEAILAAGHIPAAMEQFSPSDEFYFVFSCTLSAPLLVAFAPMLTTFLVVFHIVFPVAFAAFLVFLPTSLKSCFTRLLDCCASAVPPDPAIKAPEINKPNRRFISTSYRLDYLES